jgi:hypothetical protein
MTASPYSRAHGGTRSNDGPETSVHWLPCAAKGMQSITKCDVADYFVVEDKSDGTYRSTFRGRELRGTMTDLGEFSCEARSTDSDGKVTVESVDTLYLWNHDDIPLKSDVVPQSINLARIQNYLGSLSGLN